MKAALDAWLVAAAAGADRVAAAEAAARALAADPWSVVEQAGALARAQVLRSERDVGLTARLQIVEPGARRALVRVPAGAPFPTLDRRGRRQGGCFDTPREMALQLTRDALEGAGGIRSGLDTACGPGAFLVAMRALGVQEIAGIELDPAAAAVARIAAPGARVRCGDGLVGDERADLVIGNPPFVPPERQDRAQRARLLERLPWLRGRFDLAVPFAALSAERAGARIAFVLPASTLLQPYGAALRRRWLGAHRILALSPPERFPGAAVEVVRIVMASDQEPASLPSGVAPSALLRLEGAPLDARLRSGDVALAEQIQAASVPLGSLCEIDTGVVSHGPRGGKARLLRDAAEPGALPYVDARELFSGRRRWILYRPEEMHRPKRLSLFQGEKILIQRLRGPGRIKAMIDRDGLIPGHTLTVVKPTAGGAVPIERLLALILSPLTDGFLRIARGHRLDLYPADVRQLPVPRAWLEGRGDALAAAWGLDPAGLARLRALAGRAPRRSGSSEPSPER